MTETTTTPTAWAVYDGIHLRELSRVDVTADHAGCGCRVVPLAPVVETPARACFLLVTEPNEDGVDMRHLRCPSCGADDQVTEQDRAIRWNYGEVEWQDGDPVVGYGLGDADFEHDEYLCGACDTYLDLPAGVELTETWD